MELESLPKMAGEILTGVIAMLVFVTFLVRYVSSLNRKMQRIEALLRAWGGRPTPDVLPPESVTNRIRGRPMR
jgi:hypothetical protein